MPGSVPPVGRVVCGVIHMYLLYNRLLIEILSRAGINSVLMWKDYVLFNLKCVLSNPRWGQTPSHPPPSIKRLIRMKLNLIPPAPILLTSVLAMVRPLDITVQGIKPERSYHPRRTQRLLAPAAAYSTQTLLTLPTLRSVVSIATLGNGWPGVDPLGSPHMRESIISKVRDRWFIKKWSDRNDSRADQKKMRISS